MEYSGLESPESDDSPYGTPLTSPSSSSGYESCLSFFDDLSLFDIDFDINDGDQDLFADKFKDENIEELPSDTGTAPSGNEVFGDESIPLVSPEIVEKDNPSDGVLTRDGTAGPSEDTSMELIHTSLHSSEKNEGLHKDGDTFKPSEYVSTEHDSISSMERSSGTYPLQIPIPKSGDIEVLPAEIEKFEQHEDICIKDSMQSPTEEIGTTPLLENNITTCLDDNIPTSHLMEYCSEPPPKIVLENEAITLLHDETENGEVSDYENFPGGTSAKISFSHPLEHSGPETSSAITKIKPNKGISAEVGSHIPLEDDAGPTEVVSTKYGRHAPDNVTIDNSEGTLTKGSTSFLQVGTEPSNACMCKTEDGSFSPLSIEIPVEHIENVSNVSICVNANMALWPHYVGEEYPNAKESSLSSLGSTEIPVLYIKNGLSEDICTQTGTNIPPGVVSSKNVSTEEDKQPKPTHTASLKVDDAALPDENSEALTFPAKTVEYMLPEPLISNFGTDPDMWAPPELAENGTELRSDTNDEKEDENKYAINLLQPKSDDEIDEKVMVKIMNAEFKQLLKRFMVAEGFSVPADAGDEGAPDSWLRVVRVLSWQAALLIKPDLVAGKEMDPSLYVKIKCIASGTRTQSEVIDGLVFKKSAAHKHMPTHIRNPRLLLLQEVLDHCVSGLSSIRSMEYEKDVLEKSIKSMLDTCQPNIILVEKAASREAQELIRKQGITLVLDMKPHRMERIVRCTGSRVVSLGEALMRPDVAKECDSFRIEKFVEDINSDGKKPSKNLLFLEGLHKPLGCTILLRGANTEELKKIKRVLHYAVFAAHHVVRVLSFLSDQRLLASFKNSLFISPEPEPVSPCRSLTSESSTDSSTLSQDLDIPISDEELPLALSDIPLRTNSTSPELIPADTLNGTTERTEMEMAKYGEIRIAADPDKEKEDAKDPHSALTIVACRNVVKRTICEERHISRINYYGNSDTTLGTQLRDVFLNEKHRCSVCGDAPEAHLYVYTHRNGRITVLVTTLPSELDLSHGAFEDQDKIWMWTRCWACKKENRPASPAERYIVSESARSISFVKFLELSFSKYLPGTKMPCGHLLYRDGLRFFGMGSKVAMLRYTPVEIYKACKPPAMLEIHDPNSFDWLQKEALLVHEKRVLLFSELKRIAEELKQICTDDAALRVISHDSVLLMAQEAEAQIEVSLPKPMNSANKINKNPGLVVQDILSLNWLYQTLLLETYVWDRRLSHLFCSLPLNQEKRSACPKKSEKLEENLASADNLDPANTCDTGSDELPSSEIHNLEIIPVTKVSLFKKTLAELEPKPELDRSSILSLDVTSTIQNEESWIWTPFSNILTIYRKELQVGFFDRFNLINKYIPCHLPPIQKHKTASEPERHFIVGPGGNVLSVSEDDVSSLIAYALCISEENRKNEVESELDSSVLLNAMLSLSPEEFLSSSKHLHPEFTIGKRDPLSLKGKYTITCVYADQFYDLRKKCCPSEIMYIGSLSRCKKWNAQGGKTKAPFLKTMDDRFIIKGIKKIEFDSFLQFAPYYFNYMSESFEKGNQTCLAKILGIYQILEVRNGKEIRMDLMVTENLAYGRHLSRQYDLKGAIFARHIVGSDSCTFLDQNFIEDMRECPIYLSQRTKKQFERAIWNDTSFLTSINVMDYSLLLGVDRENRAIVFGIIDYLRQYTWDKQLETLVKSSLVVPKNELPTVISPKGYKRRFRKFMQQYVFTVPDGWGSETVNSPWILS
ncbi:1-phosphatidylinositol-3-phosphate 5-kinase [Rhynchospora pubera]|uniref:1-phosphatidylinositol-3-phosphate 5-kinase n=1 Tax=Rhynchospora pubera TaxID=906938 RepID=A0AAV8BZR1_9POAL|nr:1-phosphatidylinositol-3-phosphate 5-kinase [Rhynchospora pubera]